MNLQQILADIDLRVPNSLTDAQVVIWLNQIQRQLFRDYPLPEAVDKITRIPGVSFYDLPSKCAEDRIIEITVNDVKYDYQTHAEDAREQFWTIVAGQLMFYPEPNDTYDALIFYRPRPNELSETRLAEVPNFPEDYHELLVLGGAKKVAQNQREIALANNLDTDFEKLAVKARSEFKKPRPVRVQARRWA